MNRACERCSKEFLAQRPTAKYCGNVCRSAASKARAKEPTAKVLQLRTASAPGPVLVDPGELNIEAYVRRELGETVATAMGQMCLTAARRIDRGDVVGSALGTVLKRLDDMLEKVAASGAIAEVESDESNPITILQRRAEERARDAG